MSARNRRIEREKGKDEEHREEEEKRARGGDQGEQFSRRGALDSLCPSRAPPISDGFFSLGMRLEGHFCARERTPRGVAPIIGTERKAPNGSVN